MLHIYQQRIYVALCKNYFLLERKKYFVKQNVASSITTYHLCVWFHDIVCFMRQPLFFLISFQMCFFQFTLGSQLSLLLLAKEKSLKTDKVSSFFLKPALPNPSAPTNFKDLWIKCVANNPRCEYAKLLIVH